MINEKINEESSFEVFLSFMNFEKWSVLKQFQYEIDNNTVNFSYFDDFLENIYPGVFMLEEYEYVKKEISNSNNYILKNKLEIFISNIEKELLNEEFLFDKKSNFENESKSINLGKEQILFEEDLDDQQNLFKIINKLIKNISKNLDNCIDKGKDFKDPVILTLLDRLKEIKEYVEKMESKFVNLELEYDFDSKNNLFEEKLNLKDLEIRRILSIQEEWEDENSRLKEKMKKNNKKIKEYNNLKLDYEKLIIENNNLDNKLTNLDSKYNINLDEIKIKDKNLLNKGDLIDSLRSHIVILEKNNSNIGNEEIKENKDGGKIKELNEMLDLKNEKIEDLLKNIVNLKKLNENQEKYQNELKKEILEYKEKINNFEEKEDSNLLNNLKFSIKKSIQNNKFLNVPGRENSINYFGKLSKENNMNPIIRESKKDFRNSSFLTLKSIYYRFNSSNKLNEKSNKNSEVSKLNIFTDAEKNWYKNYKDYLNVKENQLLIKNNILKKEDLDTNMIFSDYIFVYNKSLKKFKSIIIIINKKILFLKKDFTLLKEFKMDKVYKISLSIKNGFSIILHTFNNWDIIFDTFKRIEIIFFINNMGKHFNINNKIEIKFQDNFIIKGKNFEKKLDLSKRNILNINDNLKTLFINSIKISNCQILYNGLFKKKWRNKIVILTTVGIFIFKEKNIFKPEYFIPVISNSFKELDKSKSVISFKEGDVRIIKFNSELEKNEWIEKINIIKDKNFSIAELNKKILNIK